LNYEELDDFADGIYVTLAAPHRI